MLKLVGTDAASSQVEFLLADENNRPTKLLIGLALVELTFDCLVAYGIYKLLKLKK